MHSTTFTVIPHSHLVQPYPVFSLCLSVIHFYIILSSTSGSVTSSFNSEVPAQYLNTFFTSSPRPSHGALYNFITCWLYGEVLLYKLEAGRLPISGALDILHMTVRFWTQVSGRGLKTCHVLVTVHTLSLGHRDIVFARKGVQWAVSLSIWLASTALHEW
jgi:hypothetical protein